MLYLPLHTGQMLQYFTNLHGLDSLWYAHRIISGVRYSTCISPVYRRRDCHLPRLPGTLSQPQPWCCQPPLPQEGTAGHKQCVLNPFARDHVSKSQLRGKKDTGEKNKPRRLSASQKYPKNPPKAQEWPQVQLVPSKSPHEA